MATRSTRQAPTHPGEPGDQAATAPATGVEDATRLLAEAGAALSTSLDYDERLAQLALVVARHLGDYCMIDLVEGGMLRRAAAAHRDPSKQALLDRARRYPPDPERSPLARALRTGEPVVVEEIGPEQLTTLARDDEHRRLIQMLGARSIISAPLIARGQMLGVMQIAATESARRYTVADVPIVVEVARRLALGIDNARLFAEANAARGEAERRAREEEALRRAAAAVGAAFTIEAMVDQIAESALTATNADAALVERVDSTGHELQVVAVAGELTLEIGTRVKYAGSLAERVIQQKTPIVVPVLAAQAEAVSRQLLEQCAEWSAVVVPLLDSGEPIGALILLRVPERHSFRADEVERARTFADLAALAFRKVHLLEDSERKREELERVMESRARLIRGFSHDVKNPLHAADGFAALLEDGIMGQLSAKQQMSVSRIRHSIRSALDLIEDLLEIARAESGHIEVRRQPVDLRDVAVELGDAHRAAAEAAGLTLRCETPAEFPLIRSDVSRVRQILGNLLSNAVKYTNEGEIRVTVGLRDGDEPGAPAPGSWAVVDVADTGPGIPQDRREAVFQEFTRLEPHVANGVGLGLAISRRIARILGGDISLRSVPGEGSTFTLWLPQSPDAGASRETPTGQRSTDSSAAGR